MQRGCALNTGSTLNNKNRENLKSSIDAIQTDGRSLSSVKTFNSFTASLGEVQEGLLYDSPFPGKSSPES